MCACCGTASCRNPEGGTRLDTQSSAPGGDCWPSSHAGTSPGAGGLPASCWRPGAESITALTCGAGGEAGILCRSSGILEEQGHDRNMRDTGFSPCTGIADTAVGLLLANYNSSLAEVAQKAQWHTGHWHGARGGVRGQCSHGSCLLCQPQCGRDPFWPCFAAAPHPHPLPHVLAGLCHALPGLQCPGHPRGAAPHSRNATDSQQGSRRGQEQR